MNVERFRREIQVAARLQHAHIVPVLSMGDMNGIPYYTMPFVQGESLPQRLDRTGVLSTGEAVAVVRDVAKALAFTQKHQIVHRDIKLDNVLLAGDAAARVVPDPFGRGSRVAQPRRGCRAPSDSEIAAR